MARATRTEPRTAKPSRKIMQILSGLDGEYYRLSNSSNAMAETNIRHLVVALIFDPTLERVLLVRKIAKGRMRWMNGRLNGPGGKVEPNELAADAARRELHEETGINLCGQSALTWLHTEKFTAVNPGADEAHVHFFFGTAFQQPRQMEVEPVFWLSIEEALNDPMLIDNLREFIPQALAAIMLSPDFEVRKKLFEEEHK